MIRSKIEYFPIGTEVYVVSDRFKTSHAKCYLCEGSKEVSNKFGTVHECPECYGTGMVSTSTSIGEVDKFNITTVVMRCYWNHTVIEYLLNNGDWVKETDIFLTEKEAEASIK